MTGQVTRQLFYIDLESSQRQGGWCRRCPVDLHCTGLGVAVMLRRCCIRRATTYPLSLCRAPLSHPHPAKCTPLFWKSHHQLLKTNWLGNIPVRSYTANTKKITLLPDCEVLPCATLNGVFFLPSIVVF